MIDPSAKQPTPPERLNDPARLPPAARARRLGMLSRIHRRYRTLTEVYSFGPLSVAFERIEDPNRVLDMVAEEEDRRDKLAGQRRPEEQLHLPYWAELWDSARGISTLLVSRHWPGGLAGKHVLDLGCGQGLTGSVAAALGATVLFADIEPDALVFARLNAIAFEDRIRTRRLNWRTARLPERFDLILGADILYERAQWPFLEPFWKGHLKPGGTILLGEPGRQTGDLFIDWIAPWPWTLTRREQPIPTRPAPIRIFELSPKAPPAA